MLFLQTQGIVFPKEPPVVTIESAETIKRLVGIDAYGTCYKLHVMVRNDLDLETPEGASTLVHELVHFSQGCPLTKDITPKQYVENEVQAYKFQNHFLKWAGSTHVALNPHEEYAKLLKEMKDLQKEIDDLKDLIKKNTVKPAKPVRWR